MFSKNKLERERDAGADEDHEGQSRFAVQNVACPLCGLSPLDVFHLACVCTDVKMVAWRVQVMASARQLLVTISRLLLKAHSSRGCDESVLCSEMSSEASCFDFSSDTGRFILFRLLLFHPWSARLAGSDLSQYTAAVIGELFDESGMPNMLLRPLADAWGRWSIRWAWRLGKAWREAHALCG